MVSCSPEKLGVELLAGDGDAQDLGVVVQTR